MGVSKNNGTPKSSILIGFSIIHYPFWGTPIFGNTQIYYTYDPGGEIGILGGLFLIQGISPNLKFHNRKTHIFFPWSKIGQQLNLEVNLMTQITGNFLECHQLETGNFCNGNELSISLEG